MTRKPTTKVLVVLDSAYSELMWARAKRHEFRRRFLTEPPSALTAVIGLQPAIGDEPRRITDLAEQARPGNGASVYAYLHNLPHGYAMPINLGIPATAPAQRHRSSALGQGRRHLHHRPAAAANDHPAQKRGSITDG